MDKMKLLKQVIDDLKHLSSSLDELCSVLEGQEEQVDSTVLDFSIESESKKITLEDVRAVLADKSRLGFTKEIKAIITACGATKLSDVNPQDYPTLLKKAEGLGHE
ncbi:rRNA biogenesis protein rrp5 [Carnobacteriaceae bacterium zg-ZUI252]|nr:rRNA biogenesis protein rrp5 [Carnobacteriaceae bacterium zg-ZUI252]